MADPKSKLTVTYLAALPMSIVDLHRGAVSENEWSTMHPMDTTDRTLVRFDITPSQRMLWPFLAQVSAVWIDYNGRPS